MKRLRVYVETSVVGACFDPGFIEDSLRVFEMARSGNQLLLISDALLDELEPASLEVKEFVPKLPADSYERIRTTHEVLELRDSYIRRGILTTKWTTDALHVASATAHRADVIVSWNMKHIVHLAKIRAFNEVNRENGYPEILIQTPRQME